MKRINLISYLVLALIILSSMVYWCFSTINPDVNRQHPVSTAELLCFPDSFLNDDHSPTFTRIHLEGKNLSGTLLATPLYLLKYYLKKTGSSSVEEAYFHYQKSVITKMRNAERNNQTTIKLGLFGDIMWIRNGWNSFPDSNLLLKMQQADIWLGNLETPISASNKVKEFLPDYFVYNSRPEIVTKFKRKDSSNLITALSLANNHAIDMGAKGLQETRNLLQQQNILCTGAGFKQNDPVYIKLERNGITFGLYAACWGANDRKQLDASGVRLNIVKGLDVDDEKILNLSGVYKALQQMEKDGVDFKIVSLHWGHEYEFYPTPLQMKMARKIAVAGADLILGHHPHVIQPQEVLFINGYEKKYGWDNVLSNICLNDGSNIPRKTMVVYSLGNFTTEMFTFYCQTGLISFLNITKDPQANTDWSLAQNVYIYNARNYPLDNTHKLFLLDDYMNRIKEKQDPMRGKEYNNLLIREAFLKSKVD